MTESIVVKGADSLHPRTIPQNIHFPAELPVVEQREAISEAILANQVVIIAGETGSGKTTQLPKNLFAAWARKACPDWSYAATQAGGTNSRSAHRQRVANNAG